MEYFVDSLVHAVNSSGGLRLVELIEEDEGIQVSALDIELAFPKTKETPFNNEWIPISDDTSIEQTVLNDYDIIGFKYVDDADFNIEQPVYEEEVA